MSDEIEKLKEGIAYFEQALQVMPEDRSTLEFLCIAYEQTGDLAKYTRTLVSLANVLVKERDFESAKKILENLENHNEPEVKAIELKVRAMLAPQMGSSALSAKSASAKLDALAGMDARSVAVAAELELVEWLGERKLVDLEVLDAVRGQLTGLQTMDGVFLISAFLILENENPGAYEMAEACAVDEGATPPVALESFEQIWSLLRAMPETFVRTRGVVPFGQVAGETLVALANPLDRTLKKAVRAHFGGKCHFYFASPTAIAAVLAKVFPERKA